MTTSDIEISNENINNQDLNDNHLENDNKNNDTDINEQIEAMKKKNKRNLIIAILILVSFLIIIIILLLVLLIPKWETKNGTFYVSMRDVELLEEYGGSSTVTLYENGNFYYVYSDEWGLTTNNQPTIVYNPENNSEWALANVTIEYNSKRYEYDSLPRDTFGVTLYFLSSNKINVTINWI